jgi:hypothetical protein
MTEYKMMEPEAMETVLNLQALDVQEDETDFFGNSCTSSGSGCCNDNQSTVS